MLIMSFTYLYHQGVDVGHWGIEYSMQMLALTGDEGGPIAAPWSC